MLLSPSFGFHNMAVLAIPGFTVSLHTLLNVFVAPLLAYWLVWVVYSRTLHPLAKIPGPTWASLSRTWLMYRMYLGDLETHQRALHERYNLS